MVLEHARITITPGQEAAFEAAFEQARRIIAASPGFRRAQLHRGVEEPSHYLLLVEWDTLDAHMVGFRESPAYGEWRSLIGPHFAVQPDVDHFQALGEPTLPPGS